MSFEQLSARAAFVEEPVSISLKENLAAFQSADLETIATVLRNVVGQIDTLLLERQLVEYGLMPCGLTLQCGLCQFFRAARHSETTVPG